MKFYASNQEVRQQCLISEDYYDPDCIKRANVINRDFNLIEQELIQVKQDLKLAFTKIYLRPVVYDEISSVGSHNV